MNNSNARSPLHSNSYSAKLSYPYKAISIAGLFFNLFTLCIIVLNRSKSLKSTLYNHLTANIFINMLVCLTSFDTMYDHENCYLCDDSYQAVVYRYVILLLSRYTMNSSSFSDIILMLNRYYQMSNKKNFIVNITISFNIFICLMVPSVALIFLLNNFTVEYKTTGGYVISDQNNIFKTLTQINVFINGLVLPIILLTISIFTIYKFHQIIKRRRRIQPSQTRRETIKKRFTILVAIQMTIVTFFRISRFYLILDYLFLKHWSQNNDLIFLLYTINCFGVLICHAFPCLFYIMIDTNLQNILKNLFCW